MWNNWLQYDMIEKAMKLCGPSPKILVLFHGGGGWEGAFNFFMIDTACTLEHHIFFHLTLCKLWPMSQIMLASSYVALFIIQLLSGCRDSNSEAQSLFGECLGALGAVDPGLLDLGTSSKKHHRTKVYVSFVTPLCKMRVIDVCMKWICCLK